MAVGLFGGAFDPVHAAHVRIARAAISQGRLERLFAVPNANPPHRERARAPVSHRLQMLRIALRDVPGAEARDLDPEGDGAPCYTVDTARRACREAQTGHVAMVIGADAMARLCEWRQWRELAGMCGWLVAPRRGHDFIAEAPDTLLEELGGRLVSPAEAARLPGAAAMLDIEPAADASSAVRRELRAGGGKRCGAIPPDVLDYIRGCGLYG